MTLVVALKAKDGILMGSDKRAVEIDTKTRIKTPINESQNKLCKLSKNVGIGFSGITEISEELIDELKKVIKTERIRYIREITDKAANTFSFEFDKIKQECQLGYRYEGNFILAGYRKNKEAKIFKLIYNGIFHYHDFNENYIFSKEYDYLRYIMEKLYKPEMTSKNLIKLVVYLILGASKIDETVGKNDLKIVEISKENGFMEINSDKVSSLIKSCNEYDDKFFKYFYTK
jgi:20S proteasome alpha/beta subunit